MEAKFGGKNKRIDITIEGDKHYSSQRYVIELMATDNYTAEQKHIDKTVEYGLLMNASNLWMVHYVCGLVNCDDIQFHARSTVNQNVHVLVASHSMNGEWKFYYANPNPDVAWEVVN